MLHSAYCGFICSSRRARHHQQTVTSYTYELHDSANSKCRNYQRDAQYFISRHSVIAVRLAMIGHTRRRFLCYYSISCLFTGHAVVHFRPPKSTCSGGDRRRSSRRRRVDAYGIEQKPTFDGGNKARAGYDAVSIFEITTLWYFTGAEFTSAAWLTDDCALVLRVITGADNGQWRESR